MRSKIKTPIGYMPHENDIDMTGLRIPRENMRKLLTIDGKDWEEEVAGIKEFFNTFGKDLPKEMQRELASLQKRLKK